MAVRQINRNIETQESPPMTQSDHHRRPTEDAKQPPAATPAWGTWEELLLAYAVNRYGTGSWDSISSELRKRTSAPIHLTPHHCQHKYTELKRRFNHNDTTAAAPWLEELRKLRVLELQRELENYDLYISSLQSKVKKLTEQGEKTRNKNSDLGLRNVQNESEKATNETPETVVSGQSVNGSNGNVEAGVKLNGATPVGTGDEKPESAAVREGDSCNGGPDGGKPVKSGPDGEASESMAESKSEGKNSDVQSSAWKEGNSRVPRGSSKEDRSTDNFPVRSLPLVEFLRKVQKLGSAVFERRLDRQEKLRYTNLIKQHIDYETLESRLKEGWYSDGNNKFFRDLLLLVSNTRIFFPKQSPQSTAAVDLRQLILNEMISKKKQISDSNPNLPSKRPTDPPDSLLLKPKLTAPIVVCRKRSSITAKAAAGSSSGKKEQTDSRNSDKLVEENPKKSTDSSPWITKRKGKSPVSEASDTKPQKKKKLTEAEEKKQSAAKFLNRMKQSSEPSEGGASENDRRGEQKKSGGNNGGGGGVSRGDGKKDQAGNKSSCGRKVKEQGSPAKRSVGRPPKRAAAPPSLEAVSGKRNREPADTETLGVKQMKKRSKR